MNFEPGKKLRKLAGKKGKAWYVKKHNKCFLECGQKGFLITCNYNEKDALREGYNILSQYADELYGPSQNNTTAITNDESSAQSIDDIADDLEREIAATKVKGKQKLRFQQVDTGITNCLFIRTSLPDPVELGTHIVKDIAHTREAKCRFIMRLIPVDIVCKANVSDITRVARELFDKYFVDQSSTFTIIINKRYNSKVDRGELIRKLAQLVTAKNKDNRVNLKKANKAIIVEVIKGLCCLSVVENYLQLKKYNLMELPNSKPEELKNKEEEVATESEAKELTVKSESEDHEPEESPPKKLKCQ